jgi:hypothetical protein
MGFELKVVTSPATVFETTPFDRSGISPFFPPYPAYLLPTSQLVTSLPIFLLQLGYV